VGHPRPVTIRIATAGLQTTIQDLGRVGHQRSAIPVGGAMDRIAHRIANTLVGNDESCATLEASLIGPAIAFDTATLIALTGADLEATVDGVAVPVWHAIAVPAGATLRFGRPRTGCRVYVAVAGGIEVPLVFGSRSTYLRASFGGYQGRALRAGDELRAGEPSVQARSIAQSIEASIGEATPRPAVARWSIGVSLRPRYSEDPTVRLIAGAHTELLSATARRQLTTATFRISASSDRMGYRLEGGELALREPLELMSEGVAFGTVQLPPGGAPIVLMADRQTTGGYPRIGEVASVDLPLIAQLKPADRLRFRFVSIDDAQQLYLDQEHELAQARIAISLRHPRGT
jgi:antagonist of KipI